MSQNSERLLQQETLAALARLLRYGKTDQDVRKFLERHRAFWDGAVGIDAVVADWSVLQVSAALEFAALSSLHAPLLHLRADKASARVADSLTRIILDYGRFRENRVVALAQEKILPDYKRGKKSREGGASAHGTEEERLTRAKDVYQLDQALTRTDLSRSARNEHIAKKFGISAKTVGRDLNKYARYLESLPRNSRA
jgi:hypothetical protein